MRNLILIVCLLIGLFPCSFSAFQPYEVRLYSQIEILPSKFELSDYDWRWLGEKQELAIGVYAPNNPPFDLVLESGIYKGISADSIMTIMRNLGLRFKIIYYPDRDMALQGLLNSEIDMLADDGKRQRNESYGFLKSTPYIPDYPVLISRKAAMSNKHPIPHGARIATVQGYPSNEWIKKYFPDAKIERFPLPQNALSSVAFGENDYFLGRMIVANFLLERHYATTLSTAEIFSNENIGPVFLFHPKNAQLKRTVDIILSSISLAQHDIIFHHWSSKPDLWALKQSVVFTQKEIDWLKQHNELKVVINSLNAPFTFYDSQKQFHGLSADILNLIHFKTNINFKVIEASSEKDEIALLKKNKGDFIASITKNSKNDKELLFTRPYVLPPFVLIVRDTPLAHKKIAQTAKLAITPDNAIHDWLTKNYPQVELIEAQDTYTALQMVNEGKVDGTIENLISAHYMIDRYFRSRLKISEQLSEDTAYISFAVGRDQPELYSILDKAIASIPPRDISVLTNKWLGSPDVKMDTWTVYRTEFYTLACIATILIITSLIWNYYLHREIRLRKYTQKRLQEQAIFLETLYNGTPVPSYVIDKSGTIINSNSAWESFFSPDNENIKQLSLTSQQHPLSTIYQELHSLFDEPNRLVSPPKRYQIKNRMGERVIVHQAVAYRDNQGNISGLICSWQDITEHEQLLIELSSARQRAEHASQTKSNFLAIMSHEIRTHISAIIGLLELAATNKNQQDDITESIQIPYESALSLMGLIGDILDMAKIESGKLELVPEWVKSNELATPVVRLFEGLAKQKGISLHYHLNAIHPDEIYIDVFRLRQVISNLLNNAIKFTSEGTIEVIINYLPQNHEENILRIIISDTGMGIEENRQELIFSPYTQAESSSKHKGTGLGLAICKQLISMMNGTITLYSQLGHGTQFLIDIPVKHRKNTRVSLPTLYKTTKNNKRLRILAVDDHPANRLLLVRQLTRFGHHVTEAKSGKQALELWKKNAIDIVITDCNMPDIDGLELTRQLREISPQTLIIIGLTADARQEERQRCIEAGMDDCLFKPLRLSQIEALLLRCTLQQIEEDTEEPIPPMLNSLINLDALMQLTQDDQQLLNKLLQTSLQENIEDIQQAERLFEKQDWLNLAHYCHRLEGSSQIIGAKKIALECKLLEEYFLTGNTSDEVILQFNQTMRSIKTLNQAIEMYITMPLQS